MDKKRIAEITLHGNHDTDHYFLVLDKGHLLIVHEDYFYYTNAIVFTVGHDDTDWPENGLIETAKQTVDFLNKTHMDAKFDKDDLIAMVKGSSPGYAVMSHPLICGNGQHSDIHGWEWREYYLKKLTEDELLEIYTICKNSWEAKHDAT